MSENGWCGGGGWSGRAIALLATQKKKRGRARHPPKKRTKATPWWGCRARVRVVRCTASGGAVRCGGGGVWVGKFWGGEEDKDALKRLPPRAMREKPGTLPLRGQYVVGVGRGERGGGNGGGGRGTMDKGKRHNESRQQTNHNSPRGGGVSERDSRSPAEGSLSVADRKALAAAPMQRATICPSPRRPFGRLHTVHMQHMWGRVQRAYGPGWWIRPGGLLIELRPRGRCVGGTRSPEFDSFMPPSRRGWCRVVGAQEGWCRVMGAQEARDPSVPHTTRTLAPCVRGA